MVSLPGREGDLETEDGGTLPDTDPLLTQSSHIPHSQSWGRLLPVGWKQPTTVLVQDSYSVGRSPKCDIYIALEHMVDVMRYNAISKRHFEIRRRCSDDGLEVVFLVDLSSNGTYVNRRRVGRNSMVVLANSDEISLSEPNRTDYMFIDYKVSSWLTSVLWFDYQVLKHLGTGGFSEVKLVIEKESGKRYAIKKISKDRMEPSKLYNEVKLLQRIDHPCIIKFEKITDTSEAIFICLEYMERGDLMRRIESKKRLDERESKFVFYQLSLALEYLHSHRITHRDIKAENVLIERELSDNEPLVKLSDFGLSKAVDDSTTHLRTTCGTLKYMAPEVLMSRSARSYTNAVDIWSLGVLLFLCLSGDHPFGSKNDKADVVLNIVKGCYSLSSRAWESITPEAISLIRRMLTISPRNRITLQQILTNDWLMDFLVIRKVDDILRRETHDESSVDAQNLTALSDLELIYSSPKRQRSI